MPFELCAEKGTGQIRQTEVIAGHREEVPPRWVDPLTPKRPDPLLEVRLLEPSAHPPHHS